LADVKVCSDNAGGFQSLSVAFSSNEKVVKSKNQSLSDNLLGDIPPKMTKPPGTVSIA
jgi:hypothetical protein